MRCHTFGAEELLFDLNEKGKPFERMGPVDRGVHGGDDDSQCLIRAGGMITDKAKGPSSTQARG